MAWVEFCLAKSYIVVKDNYWLTTINTVWKFENFSATQILRENNFPARSYIKLQNKQKKLH